MTKALTLLPPQFLPPSSAKENLHPRERLPLTLVVLALYVLNLLKSNLYLERCILDLAKRRQEGNKRCNF